MLLLSWWRHWSWIGVDLFFVLSGFLVSGLLFKEYERTGAIQPWRFLIRRGFKIYPGFYLLLLFTIVIELFILNNFPEDGWSRVFVEAIYIQNYVPGLFDHTWSLAIEEHFYIALVMLFFWRLRRPRPFDGLPRFILLCCGLALVMRVMTASLIWPFENRVHHLPTHLRFDSLLYGVLLSYAYSFHRERLTAWIRHWRVPIFLSSFVFIAPMLVLIAEQSRFVETIGFTLLAIAFTEWTALVLCCDGRFHAVFIRAFRWLTPIGVASYSIYLCHVPMAVWGIPLVGEGLRIPLSYSLALLVYFGGSIASGFLMARFIEFPCLRLRDRYFPSMLSGVLSCKFVEYSSP